LRYVREEMKKGSSIGDMAAMGRDTLLARMRETALSRPIPESPYERIVGELVAALDPLDRVTFERRLNGAVAVIPFEEALIRILLPLQERVGQLWHEGRLNAAVEHYVTKQVQQKLFAVMNQLPVHDQGPKVVVACPSGQWHEIGAQAAAYRCAVQGCRVYYLGPNVPLDSLAKLCAQVGPDLVVLSVPLALPEAEAAALVRGFADEIGAVVRVVAGGKGALAMRELLEREKIDVTDDFPALDRLLAALSGRRKTVR
jgi:methanogenic corrinoid protein MtbC1